MEVGFVKYKSETSFVVLLPKISFKYCNNYDGRMYATYNIDDASNNLAETLINQLNPLPLVANKKNAIILNLLVNPLFDDLCDYLSKNSKISKSKINLIKKHVFSYLGDENTKKLFSDLAVEGAEIYIQKNMYERSKKMLKNM